MSPHDAIERAARRIERETGLHFSGARRRDLPAAFARMAREAGHVDGESLASWLVDGPWDAARTALCARHLTIGETYFFREPRGLDLLCEVARTKLAADPQAGLRVWSAGCATGEEPYSMALALRINVPQLAPERTAILATDLNPASLETARAGVYREWSFRRTAPVLRSAWFCRTEAGQYRLREDVRCQVRFAQLNLAQGTYPPDTAAMDVIFCRNVLMYFSRSQMREVIARLRDCLTEPAALIVLQGGAMEFGVLADVVLGVERYRRAALSPGVAGGPATQRGYLLGVAPDRTALLDGARLLGDPTLVVGAHASNRMIEKEYP